MEHFGELLKEALPSTKIPDQIIDKFPALFQHMNLDDLLPNSSSCSDSSSSEIEKFHRFEKGPKENKEGNKRRIFTKD